MVPHSMACLPIWSSWSSTVCPTLWCLWSSSLWSLWCLPVSFPMFPRVSRCYCMVLMFTHRVPCAPRSPWSLPMVLSLWSLCPYSVYGPHLWSLWSLPIVLLVSVHVATSWSLHYGPCILPFGCFYGGSTVRSSCYSSPSGGPYFCPNGTYGIVASYDLRSRQRNLRMLRAKTIRKNGSA